MAGARDMWVADCDHVFKGEHMAAWLAAGTCPVSDEVAHPGVNNDLAKCLHVRAPTMRLCSLVAFMHRDARVCSCRMAKQLWHAAST